MTIRKLKIIDAARYRRLRLEALREAPSAFCSSYADEKKRPVSAFAGRLSSRGVSIFGAFDGKTLIGILGLARECREKKAHWASLFGMYVAPPFRRQNVGGALLDHAIADARKTKKIRYLKLSVLSGSKAARALYLSRGFAPFGLERDSLLVDGRYLDEEYMVLKLNSASVKPSARKK
jgi:ribosomal protein S18 acetylase RimI-like enzyme